jgi:L-2-hydroxyglutarate oxidase LhgO
MRIITTDFLIIGAGIIGINIALELRKRHPNKKIIILEKESTLGEHASGRNSGVLHAGFYYTQDSLKAKFTKLGNEALTQYCLEKHIPLNRCGKLVVARNAHDLPGLHELLKRGKQNSIPLELISAKEAKELEPRALTYEEALFSPTTSSVDPKLVLQHMQQDALAKNIEIHLDTAYKNYTHQIIKTNKNDYACDFIINAAGLHADKIARHFGFSKNYYILPFKGLYLYATHANEVFKRHIYPVPDLRNPFLGVHFTLNHQGIAKIGPTAIPAFWREQYSGLSRFNYTEMQEILLREAGLFFKAGFDFKRLAWNEIKKYNRSVLVKHAAELAHGVTKENYQTWGKPGIRAQLMNIKTRKLEMDFIIEKDNKSLHVLNAVSPAFTCSIPFAQHVVDQLEK